MQNETYQLLLRTAMEKGEKGAWAKGQLEGVQTTIEQMIATGVSLGVHVMTNQGGKAWGDVMKLTSSVAQLDSYNLFRKNKTEEQAKPEDSKNAFYKSIDSFKEIGTGFVGTLRTRADKATDSPYDFFNWLTLGITGDIPVGIYEAAKDRSEHMFDSKEKFADWLTLGTVEMAKGAFNPDEAWSADHWLNSLGMVTLLYGPAEKSLLPTGGGGLKPPKGLDSVKGIEVQKPLPAFSTNEGFQFKINNLDIDTPALPQTPMQINFKNEMDRILREKMEGKSDSNHSIKDVEVKAVEGMGNVDHPIRTYRNADLSKLEAKYAADPKLTVEMPYVGKGKNGTNSEGWLRDKDYYWKEVMEKYPESISKANKQKIELGFSPINDKQFREHFPQFNIKELNNDTLIHHHIGGGGQAVAVPSKLHPGSGGIHNAEKEAGIWGSDSQYAELLEKFLNK
ncbi:hypothetical protein [Paenibacillus sp. FSL H7-0323]